MEHRDQIVRRVLAKRIFITTVTATAVVLVVWTCLSPGAHPAEAVKGLAIRSAAGDTNAITALRGLGSHAVPGLVELLQYRDRFWRREAWTLMPMFPRRFRPALQARVGPLEAVALRSAGAKGLELLGPMAEPAVPALLRTLHDGELEIAMDAASALAQIGKVSVPGFVSALASTAVNTRRAAAYGLGQIGPAAEPAIPFLIVTLEDVDPQVRASSAYSLATIGTPSIAALSNIIDHADAPAREAAVQEFLRLNRSMRGMVRPLIKMAHSDLVASRCQAIEALGAIRATDDATFHLFIESLRDPAAEVRVSALKALTLVSWRLPDAATDVSRCLVDASADVREWAARLLGRMGPVAHAALPQLKQCLADSEAVVRAAAQEAIGRISTGAEIKAVAAPK